MVQNPAKLRFYLDDVDDEFVHETRILNGHSRPTIKRRQCLVVLGSDETGRPNRSKNTRTWWAELRPFRPFARPFRLPESGRPAQRLASSELEWITECLLPARSKQKAADGRWAHVEDRSAHCEIYKRIDLLRLCFTKRHVRSFEKERNQTRCIETRKRSRRGRRCEKMSLF